MGFSDLLADNVLVRWLTGRRVSYDLLVAMVGAKLGERLLVVGCSDPALVTAVAAKTGLTGRACAVDADPRAVERTRRAAERGGVLIEAVAAPPATLPFEEGAFDVAVARAAGPLADRTTLAPALAEIARVLRQGGRAIVVAASPRDSGQAVATLTDELGGHGLRGAHLLANREGLIFVEALKPRS